MTDYFYQIVTKLYMDDISILGVLYDSEADMGFKAMKSKDIMERTQLTKAKFYKSLSRLSATSFIEYNSNGTKIFITPYGIQALKQSIEGEMI